MTGWDGIGQRVDRAVEIFVGGLSRPCGGPLWRNARDDLCTQLLRGRLPDPESVESLSGKVQVPGAGHRLGAAASPQLAVEAVDVRLDGARRDEELGCDLLVGVARDDEREHLQLSLAQ